MDAVNVGGADAAKFGAVPLSYTQPKDSSLKKIVLLAVIVFGVWSFYGKELRGN